MNQDVSITGSVTISQNLTVIGTSSFTYVTSSIIQVGANTILLNTDNPATRFGGVTVIDSGSFGTSSTGDVGPTNSSSTVNTPHEFKTYMLLTCKYRLFQPSGGAGSEQEMYINGRLHHILSGTDNFTSSNSTFTIPALGIGNNPGAQNSLAQGFEMGMGLILPYWLEYAEQVKIENYFRWYYNYSF